MKGSRKILLFAVSVTALVAVGFVYVSKYTYRKAISMSDEKEIKASLDAGLASLKIARGKPGAVFDATVETNNEYDVTSDVDYSVRDRVGYLSLSTEDKEHHGRSIHISNLESTTWTTNFTDAVPISFDIQLGLGKGEFDFTGLNVKDLNLSSGASSVYLRFDQPNKNVIPNLNIEAGLSKFQAYGLGNANFDHFKFEGGVGGYTLDFSGKMDRECDADIEVGLGSLTIILPDNVGAKVYYEKSIVSHLDMEKAFSEQSENTYVSSNYYSAKGKINMHIDAEVVSVKIR